MIEKKLAKILFSTRLMAVLFIVFALSMAVGTFVENSYTTATARVLIYNAWWFEAIMVLFAINFLGNIKRYQLWKKEKWTTLLFHLSFLLIIIGAGVTRYIGYEGVMPIKEGEMSNTVLSEKTYLTTLVDGDIDGKPMRKTEEHQVLLAPGVNNHHTITTDFKGQEVTFEIVDYIHGAKRGVVPSEDGENYLKLVEAGSGNREEHYLKEGQVASIHNILFAYNKPTEGAFNIHVGDDGYTVNSAFEGDYMRMADRKQGTVAKDSTQPMMLRSLYNVAGLRFVFPDPVVKGNYDIVPLETKKKKGVEDGVVVNVKSNGEEKQVKLLGSKGKISEYQDVSLAGLDIHLRYGSKEYKLPFALRLNDFIAEKYPGTEDNPTPSYSSFKSKVDLIDEGKTTPKEIYMNHILDHKGYRFFQSSFQPDESGTILSVNHDRLGTWITYAGYFLLYLGLMLILFDKGSRFGDLKRQLDKVKAKKAKGLTILLLLVSFAGFSQTAQDSTSHTHAAQEEANHDHEHEVAFSKERIDSIIKANAISEEHAQKFGRMIIQDIGGRMKPINTYSSQLLRKISKQNDYEGLNSDQVFMSMTQSPTLWYNVPLIYIKAKNDSLHHIIGAKEGLSRVPLAQFFDATGTYKLAPYLEEAYRAKVANQFQKDFKEADEKVNLLYSALQGEALRIFPVPNDENNKWLAYPDVIKSTGKFKANDSLFVTQALPIYMKTLQLAKEDKDYSKADEVLNTIKKFQHKYGSSIMPSEQKVDAELFYNKYDIFHNLFWQYMLAGVFMFLFVILQIFYHNKFINSMVWVGKIAVLILFLLHTGNLILRWYISGHAPWSDAYESMIYVAWATMFFGLAFGRKSDLTIASTAFVASMILMIAHWNWLDPAIGNLVPVLNSYWLMIHVAVIVASYGPFTLGMILGLVSLILMILTNAKNKKKMSLNIQELTIITEMALTVGLVMLTIGNFLGGQWANESWGRYWGWDPKETWALISIMVYSFVIHMRLVPGLRSKFAFNWAAVFAYASIMMTYFGVNFYLTGLHSYASGDQIISYKFITISLVLWLALGFLANRKYKRYFRKPKKKVSKS